MTSSLLLPSKQRAMSGTEATRVSSCFSVLKICDSVFAIVSYLGLLYSPSFTARWAVKDFRISLFRSHSFDGVYSIYTVWYTHIHHQH